MRHSPLNVCLIGLILSGISAQVAAQSPTSAASKHSSASKVQKPQSSDSVLDTGAVTDGVYRNKSLGLSYKIPDGWALRTEEMNAREEESSSATKKENPSPQGTQGTTGEHPSGRVLLAAFSRPPEAKGEDINASIVIAAESVATYPGLKEAAQYFGPLTEVATGQGFSIDEEPYEIAIGPKTLVRGDFHKDIGSRVMRQSTLVFLAHGYAISITVIGGTEDEVESLIDAITFAAR